MSLENKTIKNKIISNIDIILFCFISIIIVPLLIWRCKFGFANQDESFYLTIPYRLSRGDIFFVSEWHLSQLCYILLIPFVKLYNHLRGMESIILVFRYFFVFVNFIISIIFLLVLRKESRTVAVLSSVAFLVYVPFGIPALSYNSIGILVFELAFLLFALKNTKLCNILSGVLYAISVLCCPYLVFVVLYLGYLFYRDIKNKSSVLKYYHLLSGIIGAMILFLIFLFSRANISDIIKSLGGIFDDPEHNISFANKIITLFVNLIFDSKLLIINILYLVLIYFAIRVKTYRKQLIIVSLCLGLINIVYLYITYRYINFLYYPIDVCGFILYFTVRDDKCKSIFNNLFIPGLIYCLCIHFSSNVEFYSVTSVAIIMLPASLYFIFTAINQHFKNKTNIINCLSITGVSVAIILVLLCRINNVFWDGFLKDQTKFISDGPDKGLYVTENSYDLYYSDYYDSQELLNSNSVLFLSEDTWCYLFNEWDIAAYSAWLSGVDEKTIDRLEIFYSINPDKLPDAVMAPNEDYEYLLMFADRFGYEKIVYKDYSVILYK